MVELTLLGRIPPPGNGSSDLVFDSANLLLIPTASQAFWNGSPCECVNFMSVFSSIQPSIGLDWTGLVNHMTN